MAYVVVLGDLRGLGGIDSDDLDVVLLGEGVAGNLILRGKTLAIMKIEINKTKHKKLV